MRNTNGPLRRIKAGALLLACLALLLLTPAAFADAAGTQAGRGTVDPVGQSDNYSAVMYNNTNGLPTSEANAIAQTSEGFIWIGSYSGLIRYDGNTFERMDSTTGIASVVCLHVDSRDRLWIGTNDNGLALMEQGEFRQWDVEDGLSASKICDIAEDGDGTIYVATAEGITMISPDLSLRTVEDPRVAKAYMERICMGSDGLLYCLTTADDFFTLRDGQLAE